MTEPDPDPRVTVAARNNADWCDAMCRAHGIAGKVQSGAWTSPKRTPIYYPDAVTLDPSIDAEAVLASIDTSAGCSVKDSFASLDLAPFGFELLFEAHWIHRPATSLRATAAGVLEWTEVRDPVTLARWEADWSGTHDPLNLFIPALLEDSSVTILSASAESTPVAGAVLNRTDGAVGISNVFALTHRNAGRRPEPVDVWSGAIGWVARHYLGHDVVGYESGPELLVAESAGCTPIGPLRVWVKLG